tara:strand:+ start:1773 stop:2348 length:576 start_codon:yes stop_codon:yes gene_type:complete
MQINVELDNLIESCGGEDLLRYLIKDDGLENWKTVKFNPIIAYSPKHMDKAVICGIAYWNGKNYKIIHSEDLWAYESLNLWVQSTMISEGHDYEAEALLAHNKALIVTPGELEENEIKSWEKIMMEVIYGFRSNNYIKANSKEILKDFNLLSSFFDILLDVQNNTLLDSVNTTKKIRKSLDFPEDWKNKWV